MQLVTIRELGTQSLRLPTRELQAGRGRGRNRGREGGREGGGEEEIMRYWQHKVNKECITVNSCLFVSCALDKCCLQAYGALIQVS